MRRVLPLGVVIAALGACTPTNNLPLPNDPVDAGAFVGRSCNVDAECGGLRCDSVRRQCICLADTSCTPADPFAPPQYCNNFTGLCVTQISGCTNDNQCGMAEFCDTATRACRPVKGFCEQCKSDNECGGQNDNCLDDLNVHVKYCSRACADSSQCPRGATCQDLNGQKQCWPAVSSVGQQTSCKNFQGCTPDSRRSCNATADCMDPSQRCDLSKGYCVAAQQVCPFGTTCDPRARLCVADCFSDADCGSPSLRCSNKVCEASTFCQVDSECGQSEVCTKAPGATAGNCTPFCRADSECPLGQVCKASGTRFSCQAGCATNAGCPLDQRCNTNTRSCEGPVLGAIRTCQATSACGACEICDAVRGECSNARQQFPFCATCASSAECPGGACVQLGDGNNYCAKFCGTGQAECPRGFTCSTLTTGGQACVPADRSCSGKCL